MLLRQCGLPSVMVSVADYLGGTIVCGDTAAERREQRLPHQKKLPSNYPDVLIVETHLIIPAISLRPFIASNGLGLYSESDGTKEEYSALDT